MRLTATIAVLLAVPAAASASPRAQLVPQVEVVGVFAKRVTLSVGAELAASARFDARWHHPSGRVHDVFGRVRWDPETGQAQAGVGVRAGHNQGGSLTGSGGWTPGIAMLGEVGVLGRRFGGPAATLGLVAQTALVDGQGAGGARVGITLPLRDDVDPHEASWSGRIDELEVSVRGGVYTLPSRDITLVPLGNQSVPPREFN